MDSLINEQLIRGLWSDISPDKLRLLLANTQDFTVTIPFVANEDPQKTRNRLPLSNDDQIISDMKSGIKKIFHDEFGNQIYIIILITSLFYAVNCFKFDTMETIVTRKTNNNGYLPDRYDVKIFLWDQIVKLIKDELVEQGDIDINI
jgi:hypothetical protein